MIEKTSAYKTADGTTHPTLEAAQIHALKELGFSDPESMVTKFKDAVIAILKLKPRKAKTSKPKAPKAPAKPKVVAQANAA